MFHKTKIIATIGPASSSKETLKALIDAGADVFRINASHGTYEQHQAVIDHIRALNEELHKHIAILIDLQGPKLRIGAVENNECVLVEGTVVTFTAHECMGTATQLYMTYPQFPKDVQIGNKILIDDGKLQLEVISTNKVDEVQAQVLYGGKLSSNKGVNLPNTVISLPSLTEKDLHDLDFALQNNVEWIGLSFVRSAKDIKELKAIIAQRNMKAKVVAKIEKPEAVKDCDAIIAATDALMVARGDLGVEVEMEQLPTIQKMLVRKCIVAAKPVIIATQMMESMITNISPTRAEVNDVANAVLDGADAVMLSGETSVGKYPVEVVDCMRRIIITTEKDASIYNKEQELFSGDQKQFISDHICYMATHLAKQVSAAAIIGMTHKGYAAYKIASYRPQANIFMFTNNRPLLNTLSLVWGVRGLYYDKYESTDETFVDLRTILKEKGLVNVGDFIVNIASIPLHEHGRANMIKLSEIE